MTSPRPHARPPRGLTLVEVMVALAVTAFVMVGVLVTFRAQQASFYGTQKARASQVSARNALLYLEQKLPLAGTGMDGTVAFDLSGWTPGPCPPELNPCSIDSTTDSDELVFFARNPQYWVPVDPLTDGRGHTWFFRGLPGGLLRVTAREGDRFEKGQILQVVCQLIRRYAYVTVDTAVDGPPDDGNPATLNTADVDIPVIAGDPNNPNPFRTDYLLPDPGAGAPVAPADGCFSAPAAPGRVFAIDRYRLHVRPVARPDGRYDPYLMLDTGTDTNRDGILDALDEVPIADGIESLQVGYSFFNPALGTFGMNPGTPITFAPSAADAGQVVDQLGTVTFPPAAAVPAKDSQLTAAAFFNYRKSWPNPPAERLSAHQANITAVRIGIIARSPEPSTESPATFPLAGRVFFNFTGAPAWVQDYADTRGGDDGYQRFVTETTVNVPNLLVQSVPPF